MVPVADHLLPSRATFQHLLEKDGPESQGGLGGSRGHSLLQMTWTLPCTLIPSN